MRHTRFFRFVAIAFVGLCVSFLLRLSWTSVAFGQANLQSALKEAEKNYICFSASREYPISEFQSFSQESIKTEIVQKLANQLSSCVRRRKNRLGSVDLSKLIGVTYSTQLLNNGTRAVIIAGVGKRDANDIDLTSGLESYSDGMANFLVKNADQKDFSVALEKTEIEKPFSEPLLSWKAVRSRAGSIILTGSGKLVFPTKLSLSGNEASVEATLAVQHKIPEVDAMPPHFQIHFKGNASDQDLLLNRSRKLGAAELTFNGLLLKGVPQYIEKSAGKKLKENGITFETKNPPKNAASGSWAKFSKTLEVPKATTLDATLAEYRKIEASLKKNRDNASKLLKTISDYQTQLDKASESKRKELEANLQKAQSDLSSIQASIKKNITNKYLKLNNLSLTSEFVCAPEFIREFKFPIFERKVSANTQGASASAGIGVTGDAVIDIAKSTCNVTFAPPFKVNSSIYSDISISSNGYFGARADALGEKDFGISFKSNKGYGNYSFSSMTLDGNEKEAIAQLVLKSVDNAMEDEKLLNDLANRIKDETVLPMFDKIEGALIGTDTAPFSTSQICNLFTKVGKASGSEADKVCRALGLEIPKPSEAIETVTKQQIEAQKDLERVEKSLSDAEKEVINLNKEVTEKGNSLAEKLCRFDPTGLCDEARKRLKSDLDNLNLALSKAIERRDGLIAEKNRLSHQYLNLQKRVGDLTKEWETYNQWVEYSASKKIREVAKSFVRNRILLSSDVIDTKAIARKFLDIVWKLEKANSKANELIDLTENLFQKFVPDRLSISVKASGRVGFVSRARLLETSPQFINNSELVFKDGKPSMKVKLSAYKNRPEAQEGNMGGLAPIGVIFNVQQVACIGGTVEQDLSCSAGAQKIAPPWGKNKPLLTQTIGIGIEKIAKDEKVVFDKSVPLQIKS